MRRAKEWDALDVTERAQAIGELYFRGLNAMTIARQLGAKPSEVQHHIEIIQMSAYKSEMMDVFFENLQQRTMEHLAALDSQIAICYAELDAARERVVVVSDLGNPIQERDPKTGRETGKYMMGPRHAAAIPKLLKQLEVLFKQRAEVLKIVGQKADITVKLQITQQVQTVILEFIQTLSPEVYAELYRQIEAIVPSNYMAGAIDAEFKELA